MRGLPYRMRRALRRAASVDAAQDDRIAEVAVTADGKLDPYVIGEGLAYDAATNTLSNTVAPGPSSSMTLMKAYGTSTASIANTLADLTWDTAVIPAAGVSTAGEEIRFAVSGVYTFTVSARSTNDNRAEMFIRSYINGVEQAQDVVSDYVARDSDQNTGGVTLSTAFDVTAGDRVSFKAFTDADNTATLERSGTFIIVQGPFNV